MLTCFEGRTDARTLEDRRVARIADSGVRRLRPRAVEGPSRRKSPLAAAIIRSRDQERELAGRAYGCQWRPRGRRGRRTRRARRTRRRLGAGGDDTHLVAG